VAVWRAVTPTSHAHEGLYDYTILPMSRAPLASDVVSALVAVGLAVTPTRGCSPQIPLARHPRLPWQRIDEASPWVVIATVNDSPPYRIVQDVLRNGLQILSATHQMIVAAPLPQLALPAMTPTLSG
jgi:hypothetical protein